MSSILIRQGRVGMTVRISVKAPMRPQGSHERSETAILRKLGKKNYRHLYPTPLAKTLSFIVMNVSVAKLSAMAKTLAFDVAICRSNVSIRRIVAATILRIHSLYP